MRKWILFVILSFVLGGLLGIALAKFNLSKNQNKLLPQIISKPLEKYTIENLSKIPAPSVPIVIEEELKKEEGFASYLISFTFDPTLRSDSGQALKKVTGLLNLPAGDGPFPLIVLLRGYVDQKEYKTGDGTRRAGEYFAKNGFITLAPDFLGYGGSDKEADNIFESRLQTYTTVLSLMSSVENIPEWDRENIFLWGHSNGGQIALTILAITGRAIPTVLWAPVSKPFPYSVLYYTDESDDGGKLIRQELAKFETLYDVDNYSFDKYLDRVNKFVSDEIKAPVQIHQGTNDDAVPVSWSKALSKNLPGSSAQAGSNLLIYPGADHDLNPSWNSAILQSLKFFLKYKI